MKKIVKRSCAITLTLAMMSSMTLSAGALDTLPFPGDAAVAENQPAVHGYRPVDIAEWDAQTDPYAEYTRARVPLQERNEAFAATQANPDLSPDTEYFALAGDYGNSFFEILQSNNFFSNYLYNFWQYTDYYASWHGMVTAECPPELYDPDAGWWERKFEFGILNLPNPAYSNAAHKNGSLSLGCIFLPRASQPASPMLVRNEDGTFPVADKLKEMCDYYGFDGYFINQEEGISMEEVAAYQDFLAYCREIGIYMQWYDSINVNTGGVRYDNEFTPSNSSFIYTEEKGNMADSIFLNYWWNPTKIANSVAHANSIGVDPLKTVFFGLEGGMYRWEQPYDAQWLFGEDGNPVASIATLGPDFVHHGLGEDVDGLPTNPHMNADYQWMTFERERIWFSGPEKDPTKAGVNSSVDNSQVTGTTNSNWAGMADYITERSVVNGNVFYTNFNTGHGMQYFVDGAVSNDEEWTNMNVQDILPTWQWWIDTEGTKLDVNFDYGEKYNKGPLYDYESVGAYKGGSSLVVNGMLDEENFLRLYKTDLSVEENTKVSITFNKSSADDASKMEVGVIFKNDPNTVVTFNVPQANKQTDGWVTKEISLGDYAGEEIAAIGLNFDNGSSAIDNYQMNIGELKVTDGSAYTPEKPTGFTLEEAYDTKEVNVSWDLADYSEVQQYNLYAQLSDGTTRYVGGTYDDSYYIKSLYGEEDVAKLLLTAVGKDGSESEPAEVSFDYSQNISNIQYNAQPGYIDFTWDAPANADYDSIEIELNFEASTKEQVYTATVGKDATSARILIPEGDGTRFTAKFYTVKDGERREAIAQSGRIADEYSMPYDGIVTFNGSIYNFEAPSSIDWWHMYIYENGVQKSLLTRGVDNMNKVSLNGDAEITVVLEDYNGNMSAPVEITPVSNVTNVYQDRAITEQDIPDAALLDAVKAQAGDTIQEVLGFTGTLDLSNSAVANLQGISLLRNMTGLNLSGCTALTEIPAGILAGNADLDTINLTGCTGLVTLNLSNTSLEKIVCDDPAALAAVTTADLSGSRFDFSEGTPEKALVDALSAQTEVAIQNQRPLVYPNITDKLTFEKKLTGDPVDLNSYYEECMANAVSVRGTSVETLKSADFVVADYDWDSAQGTKDLQQIKVTDANGNVTMDSIPTNVDGTYKVEYITFAENGLETVMYTQQVIVKAVTSVLEKVVAEAEQMKADGALENTMEAVVEEFNAALQAAEDLLAQEDASQADLDAAAVRLLKVMAKVDWKQGDKTILEVAVDVANSINENLDLYEEAGKQEFIDALAKAQELLASGNAWQDEIDAATDALIEAMSNLRMKPNKDILNDMIDQASGLDLSVYTEDSAAALNAALTNAQAVAADENATQDEVDAAADTLQAALNGLVFVDGTTGTANGGNGATTPVGDGTTPTKTGDAGVASLAALAMLSTGALIVLKKRTNR